MAVLQTSGAFTATSTVIELLTASLRLAQVVGSEETPTGAQLQNGFSAMSAMVKGWQAAQIHVWCEEEGILFLQPNQTQYKIGAGSPDKVTLWDDLTQTTLAVNAAPAQFDVLMIVSNLGTIGDVMAIAQGFTA